MNWFKKKTVAKEKPYKCGSCHHMFEDAYRYEVGCFIVQLCESCARRVLISEQQRILTIARDL